MEMVETDRIEKQVLLHVPKGRVWKALADSEEFGTWFRVHLEGPFHQGKQTRGNMTYPGYEHLSVEMDVERMEEEKSFAFRWHPYAIDTTMDYSNEPRTLVEFNLENAPEGTLLTVTESGFDELPSNRRDEAYRMNREGWAEQMKNIERHVSR